MKQWTLVKEQLPPMNETVLVRCGADYLVGYLSYSMNNYWWTTTYLCGEKSYLVDDYDLWVEISSINK